MDLYQGQVGVAGAAAQVSKSVTVDVGQRWRIISALAIHNDGAGPHNLYWWITRDGVTRQLCDLAAVAQNVRFHLYTVVPTRDSFILKGGDVLGATAEAMGAAAVLTIQIIYEARIGETL
jgi:hypothetical protein